MLFHSATVYADGLIAWLLISYFVTQMPIQYLKIVRQLLEFCNSHFISLFLWNSFRLEKWRPVYLLRGEVSCRCRGKPFHVSYFDLPWNCKIWFPPLLCVYKPTNFHFSIVVFGGKQAKKTNEKSSYIAPKPHSSPMFGSPTVFPVPTHQKSENRHEVGGVCLQQF